MDSRQQFEEWFVSVYGCPSIGKDKELFEAWQAGRASMRDEAAALVEKHFDEYEPWIEPDDIRKLEP